LYGNPEGEFATLDAFFNGQCVEINHSYFIGLRQSDVKPLAVFAGTNAVGTVAQFDVGYVQSLGVDNGDNGIANGGGGCVTAIGSDINATVTVADGEDFFHRFSGQIQYGNVMHKITYKGGWLLMDS